MAAAFFNALANPAAARAVSAGTQPAEYLLPEVITVMREVGIDVAQATPRRLTEDLAREANLLITMGCGEACPIVPGARREEWPLPDPKERPLEAVRQIRDQIRRRVERLLATEHWERTEIPVAGEIPTHDEQPSGPHKENSRWSINRFPEGCDRSTNAGEDTSE